MNPTHTFAAAAGVVTPSNASDDLGKGKASSSPTPSCPFIRLLASPNLGSSSSSRDLYR